MNRKPLIDIPPTLAPVLQELEQAYVVGGSVRDALLGHAPKDLDIEVYRTSLETLVGILAKSGKVDQVGKSFGVLKLTLGDQIYDFSLPRKDNLLPEGGHKGFSIDIDQHLSPQEAAARRDLTINSLAYNPKTDEILDFHGGLQDLQARTLRHTSAAFSEDPLRVLRVMQFAARFDFDVAPETIGLSRDIKGDYGSLPKERVKEEFAKMLLRGVNIRKGLNFLKDSEWIEHFPELQALDGCPQDREWHPEGDVLQHTGYTCNAMASLLRRPPAAGFSEEKRLQLMLGILCHDLGKPLCTKEEFKEKVNRVAIVSPGHDRAGVAPTESLLARIGMPQSVTKQVIPLVLHHMDHLTVSTPSQVRQLAVLLKPASIHDLGYVVEADSSGRPPLPARQPDEMSSILRTAVTVA